MKRETRQGIMFVNSELADSMDRIERQEGNIICVTLASRDNEGCMRIESEQIPVNQIDNLPLTIE
jgi:hypothetical protein